MRSSRGQSTPEYIGIVLVVGAVLVGSVALAGTDIAGWVRWSLTRGLCFLTGDRCGPPPHAQLSPLDPCPLGSEERGQRAHATIVSVSFGLGGRLQLVRLSDGTATVSLADESSTGLKFGLGEHAEVGGAGEGVELAAEARADFSAGRLWRFGSWGAARAFARRFAYKATVAGQALDEARSLCSVVCDLLDVGPPKPPPADVTFLRAKLGGRLRAEAGAGPLTLRGEAGAAIELGRAEDRRTGTVTRSWALSGSLRAALGGLVAGAAELSGSAGVDIRTGADGVPRALTLHTTFYAGAGLSLGTGKKLDDVVRGLAKASLSAQASSGRTVVVTETLDLSLPENRAAAEAVYYALGAGDLVALPERLAALRRRIDATGTRTLNVYATQRGGTTAEAGVEAGLAVGGGVTADHEYRVLAAAYTQLPGLGFLARADCIA